jgi:GntR family transcriptional repressor for pyruvate dehydrogenase complex
MEEAVNAMDQAMDDPDMFIEADLDYHLALAQGSNNALIPILIDSLVDLLREHRTRAASVEGGLERGQPYHKIILEAIKSNDANAARISMRAHLEQVRKEIETTLSPEEANLKQE